MKKNIIVSFVFALMFTFGNNIIFPQTNTIPVTFGINFFGNYGYTVDGIEGKDFNKFDIERMNFSAKSQLAENWKIQFTTDIYRNAVSGSYYSGLAVRMKYGFLDYTPVSSVCIKAGMIPGPWNGLVESLWKYRGVAQTAGDKFGFVQISDLGASVVYSLPAKYGEIAGYVLNGDGYASPETNSSKDVVFRATVYPFPGIPELKSLTLGGYSYLGKNSALRLKKQRFGAVAGYSYSFVSVGGEYDTRTDIDTAKGKNTPVIGNVFSLFTEVKIPVADLASKLSFIFRYDISDPNKDKTNDKTKFFISGLAWKANDIVTLVLDRQLTTTESPLLKTTAGKLISRDERWVINAIVLF